MSSRQITTQTEDSQETDQRTEFSTPPLRSSIGELAAETNQSWELRDALRLKTPIACRQAAERAGKARDEIAAPLLCDLLQSPRGWKMRIRRRQWADARVAAVNALRRIGLNHVSLPVVARALLDPAPSVQQAAEETILEFGAEALPALQVVLHQSGDWTFSGMQHLVSVFGQLKTPAAAQTLVGVVTGIQPATAPHWNRALLVSFRVLCGVVLGPALFTLAFSRDLILAFAVLLMLTLFGFFFWIAATLFCVLPLCSLRETRERNALAMQAAETLRLAGDKAYLPTVVEGAFGFNRISPHPARRALRFLLPLLTAEDFDRIPFDTRSQLMYALGRHDAALNLALLTAMEWVGTGEATAKVARLAERSSTPAIRTEAARVLPILQARQQQEQAPTTLLRASQPVVTGDQLLRPGLPEAATPAEQLLRPGHAE